MEVPLSSDLQSKLSRLALQQGRDSGDLAAEAIERMVDYDEWFLTEVNKGLEDLAQGRTVSHEDVGARLENYLVSKHSRA